MLKIKNYFQMDCGFVSSGVGGITIEHLILVLIFLDNLGK